MRIGVKFIKKSRLRDRLVGVTKENINEKDGYGRTLLHYVCRSSSVSQEVIQELLGIGADSNVLDDFDESPLMFALKNKHADEDVLTFLISKSAKVINTQSHKGKAPLMLACRFCSFEVVRNIIESGGQESINKANFNRQTPLSLAAIAKNNERIVCLIVKYLLKHGAIASMNKRDIHGNTSIFYIVKLKTKMGKSLERGLLLTMFMETLGFDEQYSELFERFLRRLIREMAGDLKIEKMKLLNEIKTLRKKVKTEELRVHSVGYQLQEKKKKVEGLLPREIQIFFEMLYGKFKSVLQREFTVLFKKEKCVNVQQEIAKIVAIARQHMLEKKRLEREIAERDRAVRAQIKEIWEQRRWKKERRRRERERERERERRRRQRERREQERVNRKRMEIVRLKFDKQVKINELCQKQGKKEKLAMNCLVFGRGGKIEKIEREVGDIQREILRLSKKIKKLKGAV